jgi:hypothetical protein
LSDFAKIVHNQQNKLRNSLLLFSVRTGTPVAKCLSKPPPYRRDLSDLNQANSSGASQTEHVDLEAAGEFAGLRVLRFEEKTAHLLHFAS